MLLQLNNHMMYFTVACIEMTTAAIKGNNEDLRQDKDWVPLLSSLSLYLKELFSVSDNDFKHFDGANDFEIGSLKRHDVKEEYLSAICHYLASELLGLECFEGISQEERQYIASLIQIMKYFSHSLDTLFSSNTGMPPLSSDHTNIHVMQRLNIWILNSGYLSLEEISCLGIDVLSHCIIVEMKFFALVRTYDVAQAEQEQSIRYVMEKCAQNLVQDLVRTATHQEISDDNLQVAITHVQEYSLGLQIMIHTVQNLKIGGFANIAADHVQKTLVIYMDSEKVVQLMQCLLEIMKKATKLNSFLRFMLCCVKLVQNFSLLLHCISSIEFCEIKAVCELFCEKTSLIFNAIASLPWVSLSRWEDFETDLKESKLENAYLLPISTGLDNNRLQYCDDVTLEPLPNIIVHECLKAISILHSPKYARFRCTILSKWANGRSAEFKYIALTFLPVFMVKSLPGTAAFKGILSHARTLMKNIEVDFCHSHLLSLSFLLHKIAMLMIRPCEIIFSKPLDNLCDKCEYFLPCINNFYLDFKSKKAESNLRKQKDDVLLLMGAVVAEVSNVMTERWISFSFCGTISDDVQTVKHCFRMLQTQIVEFCGDYLALIKDRPMSVSTRSIIKNWFQTMQYYDDMLLYERIVNSLNWKNGSEQVKENVKIMDDILT